MPEWFHFCGNEARLDNIHEVTRASIHPDPRRMPIQTRNPATGDVLASYDELEPGEIDRRLQMAEKAFTRNRDRSFSDRAEILLRAADLLEERAAELGMLMTQEMGKPIAQARAEAEKCAWVCRYYARHAEEHLASEAVETDASASYVAFQPLGPVLANMPWNFPFWQTFRFAAPALMAGNVGLLKHSTNVMGCAEMIEEVLREAGFDGDEFQNLAVSHEVVDDIIADDRIRAVTLTGSGRAGASVGAAAGKRMKPSVLELGGSDPFIVLADADLEQAVEVGVKARMQNNGQSCIAAKRFILEQSIADEYTGRYIEEVESLTIGDPSDEDTDIGPLAREDLRDDVHNQVERAQEDGAVVRAGGRHRDGAGYYYEPTVLDGVAAGSVAFDEEIFGPVASMIVADDIDHAVELANQTSFGLGGAVFTGNIEAGEEVALRLDVGCAFVNGMVKSDPRLPFGGVKESGYGRELAEFGIREFVNVKSVWVK